MKSDRGWPFLLQQLARPFSREPVPSSIEWSGARRRRRAPQPGYLEDYLPVPVSVTSSGLKVFPYATVTTPEIAPVAVGVKFTTTACSLHGQRVSRHKFRQRRKSLRWLSE